MQVYTELDSFNVEKPIVTIGTFDGLHVGHQQILQKLKDIAVQMGGETVVFTFWPHPRVVVNNEDSNMLLLSTLDEKIFLFEQSGVDHLIIQQFTDAFSQISSKDFVQNILIKKLKVVQIIVGFDHQFGKDREGTLDEIRKLAEPFGVGIQKVDEIKNSGLKIGSSIIRQFIEKGDMESANRFLGYNYFISGVVGRGSQIGRKIGFPTANLIVENLKLLPGVGVYAVEVEFGSVKYIGMLNLGYRPTLDLQKKQISIEVNIFGLNEILYNQTLKISFRRKIRDEIRFDSLDALKKQLEKDKQTVIRYFKC